MAGAIGLIYPNKSKNIYSLIFYSKDPNKIVCELKINPKESWTPSPRWKRSSCLFRDGNPREHLAHMLGICGFTKYVDIDDKERITELLHIISTTYNHDFRWPKLESIINQNASYACFYARHIIHLPFPEAEPYIMKSPEHACKYAQYVLRSRWLEAEQYIVKEHKWWTRYLSFLIGKGILNTHLNGNKICLKPEQGDDDGTR